MLNDSIGSSKMITLGNNKASTGGCLWISPLYILKTRPSFYVSKRWFGKLTRNAFEQALEDTLTCLDVSSVIPLMRFPSLELVDSFAEPGWESKERRLGRAVSVFSTTSLILETKKYNFRLTFTCKTYNF